MIRAIFRSLQFARGPRIRLDLSPKGKPLRLRKPIYVKGFKFSTLVLTDRRDTLVGVDEKQETFIKIGLASLDSKSNDVFGESYIMEKLNDKGSISCPEFIARGELASGSLSFESDVPLPQVLPFFLSKAIESERFCTLGDLIFSVLEQKALGFYQGDLKPANLALDKTDGVLKILDYDQAEKLSQDVMAMNNLDFLNWTFEREVAKYGEQDWLRHFSKRVSKHHLDSLFRGSSFNLATASLMKNQRTTNSAEGIYHTLDTELLYVEGIRTVDPRLQILESVEFSEGERVLDVGCNLGLVSNYLSDRGCRTEGFDLDPHIVSAARMVASILGKKSYFFQSNLDAHEFNKDLDTILLFSVFHHSGNLSSNGEKIARSCKRILIECREIERGSMPNPDSGRWDATSSWKFSSLEELVDGLQVFFPGFSVSRNLGKVDKDRYIFELLSGPS